MDHLNLKKHMTPAIICETYPPIKPMWCIGKHDKVMVHVSLRPLTLSSRPSWRRWRLRRRHLTYLHRRVAKMSIHSLNLNASFKAFTLVDLALWKGRYACHASPGQGPRLRFRRLTFFHRLVATENIHSLNLTVLKAFVVVDLALWRALGPSTPAAGW